MKLRYAMVCSSNQNRSMEAHALLKREGFDVSSYGTGQHVKQPGPSLKETNINDFGTPYKYMLENLRRKDPELEWNFRWRIVVGTIIVVGTLKKQVWAG